MALNNISNLIFNDSLLNTILILLVVMILLFIYTNLKTSKKFPPGPKGLPYFGYLPFLGSKPHIALSELRKKYGDIFMLQIYTEKVLILSSFKLIKEVLLNQIFEERPENFRKIGTFGPESGIFGSYGAPRIELRRFALSSLRNFGMGKTSLEPKIQDEIHYLIEEIEKVKGHPTDIHPLLTKSFSNIICSIFFGKRMSYTDKEFQQLLQASKNYLNAIGIDQWSNHLPQFLVNAFGIQNPNHLGSILYQKMLERIKKYDNDEFSTNNPENFINIWRAESEKSNAKKELYNENTLTQVLAELFIAGSDTTSVTLEWAILYLIKHPETQQKIQMEIDNVIGRNRAPTMSDQKLMPYTEATILEVTRITSIVPLNDPHCASQNTSINGFHIPKYTSVWTNLWALQHDPEIFPQPENFMPERFLMEDNKLQNIKELIPFSIGKRQCPGEALARMTLFLYLVSLLQHFNFTKLDDVILDTTYCIVLEPVHQKICANLRK